MREPAFHLAVLTVLSRCCWFLVFVFIIGAILVEEHRGLLLSFAAAFGVAGAIGLFAGNVLTAQSRRLAELERRVDQMEERRS
jgi:hypothetical protein